MIKRISLFRKETHKWRLGLGRVSTRSSSLTWTVDRELLSRERFRDSPVAVFACHCHHKRGNNRSRDPTRRFLWPRFKKSSPSTRWIITLLVCCLKACKRPRYETVLWFGFGDGRGGCMRTKVKRGEETQRDFWRLGDLLLVAKCNPWLRYFPRSEEKFYCCF